MILNSAETNIGICAVFSVENFKTNGCYKIILVVPLHHYLQKMITHKLVEKNKQIRLAAAKKTIEELEK